MAGVDEVEAHVRALIVAGGVGTRLPSIAALVIATGHGRSVAHHAYERLRGQGLVEGRHGSGYYVAGPRTLVSPAAVWTLDGPGVAVLAFRDEGGPAAGGAWTQVRAMGRAATRADLDAGLQVPAGMPVIDIVATAYRTAPTRDAGARVVPAVTARRRIVVDAARYVMAWTDTPDYAPAGTVAGTTLTTK